MAYLYCIPFSVWASKKKEFKNLTTAHEDCVFGLRTARVRSIVSKTRGNMYIIDGDNKNNDRIKTCFLTFFGAMHFLLYMVIGLLVPNLFLETFIIGIAFELYEYYQYQCHDAFDIVFNTAGFLVGRTLRLSVAPPNQLY